MASQDRYYSVLPWNSVGQIRHCGEFWSDDHYYLIFYDSKFTYIYPYIEETTASKIPAQEPFRIPSVLTGKIISIHVVYGHIFCFTSSGIVGKITMTSATNFKFENIGKLAFCNSVIKSYPLRHGSAAIVEYMDNIWLRIYNDPPVEGNIDSGATISSKFGHKLVYENEKKDDCQRFLLLEVVVSEMTKDLKHALFPLLNPLSSNILIMCDPSGGVYYLCTKYVNEGLRLFYSFTAHVLCVSLIKLPNEDKHYGLCFVLSTGVAVVLSGRHRKNVVTKILFYVPLNQTKACAITRSGDIVASDGADCYLCRIIYDSDKTMVANVKIAVKGISGMYLLRNDRIHAITKCGVSYVLTTSLINEVEEYNRKLTVTDKRYSIHDVNKLYEDVQRFSKSVSKEETVQTAMSLASRGDYVEEHVKSVISVYSECDLAFEDKNCKQHVIDMKIIIDDASITIDGNIFELIVKISKADKKEWNRRFPIDTQITHKNPLRISFRIEFSELDLVHGILVNTQFSFSPCGNDESMVIMPLKSVYLDISYFYTPTNDTTCKKSKSSVDMCLNSLNNEAIQNETKVYQFSSPDNSLKLIDVLNELFSNATHRFPSSFLQQFEGIENGICFVKIQDTIVRIELYEGTTITMNGTMVEGKYFKVQGDNEELTRAVKMNIVCKMVKKIKDISVDGNIVPSLWKLQRVMQIMQLQKQSAKNVIPLMDNLGVQLFL